jgi:hypothetical protein
MEFKNIALPINVLEDIVSPESKKFILTELSIAYDAKRDLEKAKTTIAMQDKYIEELERCVDIQQKTLDALMLNKCRTRKVKVKVYGRSPVDKALHRYVRQAED